MRKSRTLYLTLGSLIAGCLAVFSAVRASDAGEQVTYSKDVAPIFFKNCAQCHRPNDIAPMSLLSYKDARPWARSIRQAVASRDMPPWHVDPQYGHFSNDMRLSQQDIDTIVKWVDQGAKEGDPKELPPAPTFTEGGWALGKPDIVLTMPEPYTVQANGPDQYLYFSMPTNFKQDMWIQGAEIHPGNKKVVHHIIAFVEPPEMAALSKMAIGEHQRHAENSTFYTDGKLERVKMDARVVDDGCADANGGDSFRDQAGLGEDGGFSLLAGYAPGKAPDVWPEGTAKKVPAGSIIVFQVHYSNFRGGENKTVQDQSSIGLFFAKQPPTKQIVTLGIENTMFKIPPGDPDHMVSTCFTFKRDVELIDYMPHMHLRGKDMRYDVIYPDGRKETLLNVPDYNFNWQTMYLLDKPVVIPKGTKMIITAHFDNSERNKYNPDPTKAVRWGDPTYDEMMIGWMDEVFPVVKDREVATLSPELLDSYAGTYQFTPTMKLALKHDGNALVGQATGMPEVRFYPASDSLFFMKGIKGELTVVKNDKGEATEVVFSMGKMQMHGKRVSASETSAPKK